MHRAISTFEIKGDPNAVDSFAACVTAVAVTFGIPVDYQMVEALTGTCFSPCHNRSEDCIGWMMDGGNAYRVDFIAQALGFGVEKITMDPESTGDWVDIYAPGGSIPVKARAYFDLLQQAVEAGRMPVLATWPAWSVLTGWDEDLRQLPFATTPGFEPVVASIWPPLRTRLAFIFTPSAECLPEEIVYQEALKFSARIASEQFSLQVSGYDAENMYGGAMYDVIIERSRQPVLCPGCGEDGCFGRSAKRVHDGHRSSAFFLHQASSYFSDPSFKLSLSSLATSYDEMGAISRRYLDWNERPLEWALPETRQQIASDFSTLRELHNQAAQQMLEVVTGITSASR